MAPEGAQSERKCSNDLVQEVHRKRIWDQLRAAGSHYNVIFDSSDQMFFCVETLAQPHTPTPKVGHDTTLHFFDTRNYTGDKKNTSTRNFLPFESS